MSEERATKSCVTFSRSQSYEELMLDGTPSIAETNYDVEVYGFDIDATATLASQVRSWANGFRGRMGSSVVLGMFASSHSDDYVPKVAMETDEGLHVFTFQVKVLT